MKPYYEQDGITIYHTRCEDVMPLIDPSTVDLLLTDPPYGYGQSDQARNSRKTGRGASHPNSGLSEIVGDREPFDPASLLAFRRVVIFGANHFADRLPPSPSWIVWDRRNGSTPDTNADAELIWTNCGGAIRTYRQTWRGFAREGSESGQKHLHPTQKPVDLMVWLVERYTKPGDLLLDPYMGSGPIAKACHMTGRRYIGIEVEEQYVKRAIERLSQLALPLEAA